MNLYWGEIVRSSNNEKMINWLIRRVEIDVTAQRTDYTVPRRCVRHLSIKFINVKIIITLNTKESHKCEQEKQYTAILLTFAAFFQPRRDSYRH